MIEYQRTNRANSTSKLKTSFSPEPIFTNLYLKLHLERTLDTLASPQSQEHLSHMCVCVCVGVGVCECVHV